MSKPVPVSLPGSNKEIRTITDKALNLIFETPGVSEQLSHGLRYLYAQRFNKHETHTTRTANVGPDIMPRWTIRLWYVCASLLFVSGVSAGALVLPARHNVNPDPELLLTTSFVCTATTLLLAITLLVSRIPRTDQSATYGQALIAPAVVITALGLIYRTIIGFAPNPPDSTITVMSWYTTTVVTLIALIVLSARLLRLQLLEQRKKDRSGHRFTPKPKQTARELLKYAQRLADTKPARRSDQARLAKKWEETLQEIPSGKVNPTTIEQATAMTPIAWVVWAYYSKGVTLGPVRIHKKR